MKKNLILLLVITITGIFFSCNKKSDIPDVDVEGKNYTVRYEAESEMGYKMNLVFFDGEHSEAVSMDVSTPFKFEFKAKRGYLCYISARPIQEDEKNINVKVKIFVNNKLINEDFGTVAVAQIVCGEE